MGFPCSSAGEESACNAGDLVSIPGLGRSPGEGKGYPLQYSGLENSMDHIVHGVAKSWTRLGDFHPLRTHMSSIHQDSQGLNWTLLQGFQVLMLLENGCAPHLLSENFLLPWYFAYQVLLQGPVVAWYWVCSHVPMCWLQRGLERECLSFGGGISLSFFSTHDVRNPPNSEIRFKLSSGRNCCYC